MFATMLVVIQLVVSVVVGLYFFRQLRQSRQKEPAHGRESNREWSGCATCGRFTYPSRWRKRCARRK